MTADERPIPTLDPIQARLLGCLVEKEAITPDQYPLTENAIVVASNQKTSRDPVMELTPGEVGHTLRQLEPRQLVRSVHGARAQRYEHRLDKAYSLTAQQQALLAMLLLRGPQTLNELQTRTERMAKFAGPDDARHALERMAERVIVLIHGRLAAAGGHHAIRDAMDDRPRHVLVRSNDGRRLAASLVALGSVSGVTFDAARDGVVIETAQARELATALPHLARQSSIRLLEVRALDDSLESLFRELVR